MHGYEFALLADAAVLFRHTPQPRPAVILAINGVRLD